MSKTKSGRDPSVRTEEGIIEDDRRRFVSLGGDEDPGRVHGGTYIMVVTFI